MSVSVEIPSRRSLRTAWLAALLGLLASTSCVQLTWQRVTANEPIAEALWQNLEPDQDTLTECLAALGAPNRVWETGSGDIALAYWWFEQAGWSFSASAEVIQFGDASFRWDSDAIDRRGLVLLFDPALRLESIRTGLIREIAPSERRRPLAFVDQ